MHIYIKYNNLISYTTISCYHIKQTISYKHILFMIT